MRVEDLLKEGKLDSALAVLQEQVRAEPANAKLRVFLFQLLSVLGDWPRALAQLNAAAELSDANLLLAAVYREALSCEALRAEVFAGTRSPLVFGQPAQWVGWLIEAQRLSAEGRYKASQLLRAQAFEAAPAVAGTIDGKPFEWIADADMRLGPMLEAVVDGKYYWVPFENIRRLAVSKPSDLRDLVWAPAQFQWTNGGQASGLVPARYPSSESSDVPAIRMARRTEWVERDAGFSCGLGQRMLATDGGEYPLLETRSVCLGEGDAQEAPHD